MTIASMEGSLQISGMLTGGPVDLKFGRGTNGVTALKVFRSPAIHIVQNIK